MYGFLFIIISWLYATSTQQFIFFPCNANHCAGNNIFCISLSVKSWHFVTLIRVVSNRRLEEQNSTRTDIIHWFWGAFFCMYDISPLRMTQTLTAIKNKTSLTHTLCSQLTVCTPDLLPLWYPSLRASSVLWQNGMLHVTICSTSRNNFILYGLKLCSCWWRETNTSSPVLWHAPYSDKAMGWTICGSIPCGGRRFFDSPKHSDQLWGLSTLLFSGYQHFFPEE